ncbi:hypothetical protein ARMSODRAFT_134385 [Armillaria solidipes]|uniref:Uncharacterized protein n=1 Tax=Armillaria solidipes TaxID=1076256 RepID=A0A2H3ANN3_9AGAR|nr:hypothetical protein ARMSODRAFT_134385 [Armillaria solidipes]
MDSNFTSLVSLFVLFVKGRNETDPPMLQDVGLSLGCNPGRKIQSLVARLNNNMAVKSTARTCYILLYHVLGHIFSHAGCAVWKWPRASNSARACPDPNAILSRYLRRSREGNLDCFVFNSRRHVCEPIDVESVALSSRAPGGHLLNPITRRL